MDEAHPSPSPAAAPPLRPRDPLAWTLAIAGAFALIAGWRLGVPAKPYFDEVHYLPAARDMIAAFTDGAGGYRNREHPLVAKELIALGMWAFGDNPLGWRIVPWIAGVAALFASMRALWHASHDRFATLAFAVLLATGFPLLIHARIAMLQTPDGHGRLELFEYIHPDAIETDPTLPNEIGMHRVAFSVDDIDEALQIAARHGCHPLRGVANYQDAYKLTYLRGPSGIIVMLAEELAQE